MPSLLAGCYLVHGRADPGDEGSSLASQAPRDPFTDFAALGAVVDVPEELPDTRDCTTRLLETRVTALPVDMLFVVDNSGSMREEQAALARELPRMVELLSSGDRDGDGQADFPPVADLHLGVVSVDMGLVGIPGIPGCEGLGDDGILNTAPVMRGIGCEPSYPPFISYLAGQHEPRQVAEDFACVATLGTEGCGFEQQLEAGLKALWPSLDIDPVSGEVIEPNRIRFLGDAHGFGRLGHGDAENAGFLRNDSPMGPSLVAVIVVSDEEDCSSFETWHFTPEQYLRAGDPLADQDLNLRCFYNPDNLYALRRYENGFRALRPFSPELFFFAAIVGVPADLVDSDARAAFDLTQAAERDRYYDSILDDERMQQRPDPTRTPEEGGQLVPSCESPEGKAYPPRRFVELARSLGPGSVVQSICQSDFSPAIDAIVGTLSDGITVATCAAEGLVEP
ncbi:MAG: hypothetical protein OEZ06_00985 [Myxococcales bacterium]|nr:hypothetical protein [Myxococcales bacterium]